MSLNNRFTYYLLIFIYGVIGSSELFGQALKQVPITHQVTKKSNQRQIISVDTLALPFWDDFSESKNQQTDTSLWAFGDQIAVNNGLAYLPPTYNVALLDGYDASGTSYSSNPEGVGIGDSLVSHAIDLSNFSTSDNISLSFFWQEGFGPTAPDSNDSLRLYFKTNDSSWVQVFSVGGSGLAEPIPFQQQFEQLNQAEFFHAGFQFKFEYYGNLAGDFDTWSIDYIYLNEGNTSVNTLNFAYDSYEDRTFSSINKNMFSNTFGIPLEHVTEDWLIGKLSEGSLIYNNLWAGDGITSIFGTEIFGTIWDTLRNDIIIDSIQIKGNFLTNAQDTALFTSSFKSANNIIDYILSIKETEDSAYLETRFNLGNTDSLLFETVNGTKVYYNNFSFRANDTIRQHFSFHDYYALDDGSAEAGLQLNSKNYQLAQQFDINGGHYMTGIDIYFPNMAQNGGNKNITLLVLDSISGTNTTDNVELAQNILVSPSSGLNKFQRFNFEKPIFVEGTIYVGYREENDDVISIGLDKNTNSATNLYYNRTGSWERNDLISGSLMIRPVFEDITDIVSNRNRFEELSLQIWPNPTKGEIQLNKKVDQVSIFNLRGQLQYQVNGVEAKERITLPVLPEGLYLAKVTIGRLIVVKKILIKH